VFKNFLRILVIEKQSYCYEITVCVAIVFCVSVIVYLRLYLFFSLLLLGNIGLRRMDRLSEEER
jgi:hypothetical protein